MLPPTPPRPAWVPLGSGPPCFPTSQAPARRGSPLGPGILCTDFSAHVSLLCLHERFHTCEMPWKTSFTVPRHLSKSPFTLHTFLLQSRQKNGRATPIFAGAPPPEAGGSPRGRGGRAHLEPAAPRTAPGLCPAPNRVVWLNEWTAGCPRRDGAEDAKARLPWSQTQQISGKERPPPARTRPALGGRWAGAMCSPSVPRLSLQAPAEPAPPPWQYLLPLPARPALPAADHSAAAGPADSRAPPRLPRAADCFRVQEPPIRMPAPRRSAPI